LAEDLAATCRVLAPVATGGTVTFRRFQPGMTLDLHSRMAAVSPKAATFPQTETLLVVKREGDGDKKPELIETLPQGKSVVIGCRPCGARGKLIFNPVYETDKIKDPYFIQRRDNTVFITLACDRPETTCFCHSVGSGPADTEWFRRAPDPGGRGLCGPLRDPRRRGAPEARPVRGRGRQGQGSRRQERQGAGNDGRGP
jgi:sulfhydrogenase subunit beta (sulfur reductase)